METKEFRFWYLWLLYSSIIFALFGIIVACLGDSIIFSSYNMFLTKAFWNADKVPSNVVEFKSFIYGPLGATITGKYIMMLFIIYFPFKNKEKWAWYSILVGQMVWFIIDSSISVYYKAYFNVLFVNLFAFTITILPLICTRKFFFSYSV